MDVNLSTALIAGVFGLGGALGGVLLSSVTGKWSHDRSLRAEDERRWQHDRRTVYAAYLSLVGRMLKEIDGVAGLLRYSETSEPISDEDEELVRGGLLDYFEEWETAVQLALGEIQLLASPRVADLADRVSGALMEITVPVETRSTFVDYYPAWFQALDLSTVLRDAMRMELGLDPAGTDAFPARRDQEWPWLSDRPTRSSYLQNHPDQ
ncbi:hypothetical protein GXW84_27040 [Rhodococcus sp. IEGM 248]|nr:hypothetical protein [Rhodococcus sp. IEGM 248]